MRNGWEVIRLGDICETYNGSTPLRSNKEFWTNGNINWFTIDDIRSQGRRIHFTNQKITKKALEKTSIKLLPKNTILLCCTTSIGEFAISEIELTRNQQFNALVVKNESVLFPEYLFHFCATLKETLFGLSGKTTIDFVSMTKIKEIEIPIPSLPEQKRIVAILDEAFAAIDQAKSNTQKNLQNAKELFDSYLQNVFAKKEEDWEVKRLKDVAAVIGGYSFKSGDFKKSGKYQVLRMGNVRPGTLKIEENPIFIDKVGDNVLYKALLKLDDVIITQTGTKSKRDYGFTDIIDKHNFLLNQRIARIRFTHNYLPKFFLYFSWTNLFKDQYFSNKTGTVGQGNVGIGAVTDAIIPFCSLKIQSRIVSKIDLLLSETKKLEIIYLQKLNSLDELKKSILQKAFAGELTS
jgi:type I restriction enzyme S subunit